MQFRLRIRPKYFLSIMSPQFYKNVLTKFYKGILSNFEIRMQFLQRLHIDSTTSLNRLIPHMLRPIRMPRRLPLIRLFIKLLLPCPGFDHSGNSLKIGQGLDGFPDIHIEHLHDLMRLVKSDLQKQKAARSKEFRRSGDYLRDN